jgi:2,3-bisphosphoglycerate-independent phosphoglycerate mutase
LLTVKDDKILNHSAGHILTEEAAKLIGYLNDNLATDRIRFYPGVSYRHLLVIKNGIKQLKCTPPHDVPGTNYINVLPVAETKEAEETASIINDLIAKSQQLLENHPVNLKRKAEGKEPGNSIWPWSPGYKPSMQTLKELYGLNNSAVISAVDLIHGIGIYAGMRVIHVEGVTGLYNTNYEGKAKAAIDALAENDLVYLHIEASDEAGHEGDVKLKTKTIEYLDNRVVKYILEEIAKMKDEVAIAVLPDHPTPCALRTHTRDAVPVIIYKKGIIPDEVEVYDEFSVEKGSLKLLKGNEFIKTFLGLANK